MLDAQPFFLSNLTALENIHGMEYSGILTPEDQVNKPWIGVGRQFKEEAEKYHKRSFNPEQSARQIKGLLSKISQLRGDLDILDVGAGTGNSVFALLDLFPRSKVVALDISHYMLSILHREAKSRPNTDGRYATIAADLHGLKLTPNQFDLVCGGSILHHLIDPFTVLKTLRAGLRPGGEAIFVEPFENCWSLLKCCWLSIISEAALRGDVGKSELGLMSVLIDQWDRRNGRNKSDPILTTYDDKWLFTRNFIQDLADQSGFQEVRIHPDGVPPDILTAVTHQCFNNLLGEKTWSLPDWSWRRLTAFEKAFSDDLRRELFAGAVVVFRN